MKKKQKLSEEMQKCIDRIKMHGSIIRYKGGFWAEENAEMVPMHNFGRVDGYYPKDYFGTLTIQALLKRELIKVDESKPVNMFRSFPIKVSLKQTENT